MINSIFSFRFIIILIGIFLLNSAVNAESANEDEIQQLKSAIKNFNNAFVSADIGTLDMLLAAEYSHTNSGSKAFGKTSWLNWVKSRKQATDDGVLKYTEYVTEDMVVKMFHGFAIVTGRNIATGINNQKPFKVDIRFTHVWLKRDSRWLRVAFHDAASKH